MNRQINHSLPYNFLSKHRQPVTKQEKIPTSCRLFTLNDRYEFQIGVKKRTTGACTSVNIQKNKLYRITFPVVSII